MHKHKTKYKSYSFELIRKRETINKILFAIFVLIMLVFPTVLGFIVYHKLNRLQTQIDLLMIARYGVTYDNLNNDNAVLAVNSDNSTENDDTIASIEIEETSELNQENDGNNSNNKENTNINESQPVSTSEDKRNDKLTQSIDKDNLNLKDKTVYLTFDDGPSKYTDNILNILSEYNVKASFFVVGKTDENSLKMYQRIVDEGHALGMHSYSHEYNKIYKSVEDFDKDFTKLSNLLYDTTGHMTTIYRFPGGSSNKLSDMGIKPFIKYLDNKSITYFDWNVENGDATGDDLTPTELYHNVISGIGLHKTSIVLMHDTNTKMNTVESLVLILKTLKNEGAKVLPLDKNVTPIQQVD